MWVWDPALETFEETCSPKWAMHPGEAQVLLPHLGSQESLPFFLLSKTLETKRNNTSCSGQPAWAPSWTFAGAICGRVLPDQNLACTWDLAYSAVQALTFPVCP